MAGFHVIAGASDTLEHIRVRKISISDLIDALKRGVDDFMVKPSHIVFLCLIYPIVGVVLAAWTSGNNALPLLFPLVSGFALIGPFAAIGLYEISRRREAGLDTSWSHAFEVKDSPALPAIAAVGMHARRHLHRLAADRAGVLPAAVRPAAARIAHPASSATISPRPRLDADHPRPRHRLRLCGGRALHHGRRVPAAARPRRRRLRGHPHLGARGAGQPDPDGGLGADRRRRC